MAVSILEDGKVMRLFTLKDFTPRFNEMFMGKFLQQEDCDIFVESRHMVFGAHKMILRQNIPHFDAFLQKHGALIAYGFPCLVFEEIFSPDDVFWWFTLMYAGNLLVDNEAHFRNADLIEHLTRIWEVPCEVAEISAHRGAQLHTEFNLFEPLATFINAGAGATLKELAIDAHALFNFENNVASLQMALDGQHPKLQKSQFDLVREHWANDRLAGKKPRYAPSGYTIFVSYWSSRASLAYPGETHITIVKVMGMVWKNLDDSFKNLFLDIAKRLKLKHREVFPHFEKELDKWRITQTQKQEAKKQKRLQKEKKAVPIQGMPFAPVSLPPIAPISPVQLVAPSQSHLFIVR